MRIALGIIVSAGFRCDTDFLFGRAQGGDGVHASSEGLYALVSRVQSGLANQALPDDLKITGMRTIVSRKFPTDVARNEICAAVLAGDEDYLLFLDADMVHPGDLLERLLSARKDVITARYHLKKAPFASVVYVKHPTQEGPHRYISVHFGQGVFEIERGGAGALLIHRSVLQDIHARQGHNWFRYQRGPEPPHDLTVSEDFWFYQQARETGHTCWVDWDCVCPHIGQMAIDDSWNTPFLHAQVNAHDTPEALETVLKNTVVRNYPDGMFIGDADTPEQYHIKEYVVTEGER